MTAVFIKIANNRNKIRTNSNYSIIVLFLVFAGYFLQVAVDFVLYMAAFLYFPFVFKAI